jgi:CTP:molybdopterin cytidylyltransferase MocA
MHEIDDEIEAVRNGRSGGRLPASRPHPRARGLIGGIVLAGGEGRRFGSPKQLARLRGRPLIEWAVEAMLAAPAIDSVVVVLGARFAAIRGTAKLEPARTVVCDAWRE